MRHLSSLTSLDEFDLVVVGAGPTGLISAYEGLRHGLRVLLIDQGEFQRPEYSAISIHWDQRNHKKLGGIGGTANGWMGQSLRFSKDFFNTLFPKNELWSFNSYIQFSSEVEKLIGVRVAPRNRWKGNRRLSRFVEFNSQIDLQNSFMPREQRWEKIFSKTLRNSNLYFYSARVESLNLGKDCVQGLVLANSTINYSAKPGLFVLSTNTICNSDLLKRTNEYLAREAFRGIDQPIYDHPYRTKLFFDGNGTRWLQRRTFTKTLSSFFRLSVKDKFVVLKDKVEIGVFEIRPEYNLPLFGKVLNRFSLMVLGYSPFRPYRVGIWVQIAQVIRTYSSEVSRGITDEDLYRFEYIEEIAQKFMIANGYKVKLSAENVEIFQAFHPSGSIRTNIGTEPSSFGPTGASLDFRNLQLNGGAIIQNGSWINPTIPIMSISLKGVRDLIEKNRGKSPKPYRHDD